jgi:hypothetical protein
LAQHDLGPEPTGNDAPLAMAERMFALHRCTPQPGAAGSAPPFGLARGLAWSKASRSSGSAPISVALARKAASSAARASFVFPDGKIALHLLLTPLLRRAIAVDAVFAFNETRRNPRLCDFNLDDATGFVRELVNAVYYAKTSFFLADSVRATINVAANGYRLEITRADETLELIISTGAIWRLIKGLMVAIDRASPIVAN